MNNKGQVGIIVAILVISLLVAVLVIIQTYYVPQWMKDREAEHMDVVANQFASLKYSIDLQAMERSSSPLINSVTLGSKELPYFISPAFPTYMTPLNIVFPLPFLMSKFNEMSLLPDVVREILK